MTTRRKESIKITCFSILSILILSMILATIMYAINTPKCTCYETIEYNSEVNYD